MVPNQTEAWQQLTNVADAEAVPSLEQMFATSEPEVQQHIVEVMGKIEEQVATDALVRLTNTYFVGEHRVLVHDNMPRRAMDLPVPGWSVE